MNDTAVKEMVARLRKEVGLTGAETDKQILDLRVEVDRLKLELLALKTFLGTAYPAFREQFPQILAETIQEVDPESD